MIVIQAVFWNNIFLEEATISSLKTLYNTVGDSFIPMNILQGQKVFR